MSKLNSLCNKLIQEASKSPLKQRLAACIIQNGKLISNPMCNNDRSYCKRQFCSSLHAEARVMISYFGSSISYDNNRGWCFKRDKYKQKQKWKKI